MDNMDLTKLFHCCNINESTESQHQMAILYDGIEPKEINWRIASVIYSEKPIDYKARNILDKTDPQEKKVQVVDYLDYHLNKYGSKTFINGVEKFMYFQNSNDSFPSKGFVPIVQKNFVDEIVKEWCIDKRMKYKEVKEATIISKVKTINKNKSFGELLFCDGIEKEKVITKLHPILDNAKGKKIATVLFALKELSFITLGARGKAEMYRALEVEFGLTNIASGVNRYIFTNNDEIKPNGIAKAEIEDIVKILKS